MSSAVLDLLVFFDVKKGLGSSFVDMCPSFIDNAMVRLGSVDLLLPLPAGARLSRIPFWGGGLQGICFCYLCRNERHEFVSIASSLLSFVERLF